MCAAATQLHGSVQKRAHVTKRYCSYAYTYVYSYLYSFGTASVDAGVDGIFITFRSEFITEDFP